MNPIKMEHIYVPLDSHTTELVMETLLFCFVPILFAPSLESELKLCKSVLVIAEG